MLRYETLFLVVPEITTDEASKIESQLNEAINNVKGTVLSYDRWGKFKLAYPIRNYDYGIYFLIRFEVSNDKKDNLLERLRTIFSVRQADLIMRYIIMSLNPEASLEYKRPDSLEDVPTRDVDTFLKENKMTGLLSNKSSNGSASELDEEAVA